MKKDINIKVIGTHKDLEGGDEHEIIENIYPATYFQKEGCHYIFYEEDQEGFGPVQNRVILYPEGHVRMTKKGVINSDMEFSLGESRTCDYKTPLSIVEIAFQTEHLEVDVTGDTIYIHIVYVMDLNGEPYSKSTVEIRNI